MGIIFVENFYFTNAGSSQVKLTEHIPEVVFTSGIERGRSWQH